MTAGGLPTIQVLLDDGTGTFPYDITSRVRLVDGIDIPRGRGDELSDIEPGQCSFTLENSDGALTLGSTIIATPSPIRIDQQIRVKYTANASTVNRSTGFAESLPVAWPTGSDLESRVKVTLVDVLAVAERRILRSVIEEEIMSDSPSAYYTLGEPAGALTAADSSGNQAVAMAQGGSGTAVTFGATGPSTAAGLTTAAFAAGGKYLKVAVPVPPNQWGYMVAFKLAAPPAASSTLVTLSNGSGLSDNVIAVLTDGRLRLSNSVDAVTTAGSVADGAWHVVEIRATFNLYVDGVLVGSATQAPVPSVVVLGANLDGTQPLTGSLAHFAFFIGSVGLTAARVTAHAQAILTGFAGESGTARLTRIAGYAGIPLGTLDASLTNVAFEDFTGTSAGTELRNVTAAEFGTSYANGSGALDFHNRNRAPAKVAPDVTFTQEFLAEDTQFIVDMQGVLNYFETTAVGTQVTQVVRNTVSELGDGTATNPDHGRYPGSATYLVSTDAEALDRANWIVANHAQPAPRAGTLKLDLLTMTAAQQATALAIEADTWVRITGLPSQTPGGTTADFVVQGFADHLDLTSWTLTLNVVSRSLFQAWVLDDTTYSVLDSTTRVFV